MRLLFVNSAWAESWGGGEKWTVDAAAWFRAEGHETRVVGRPKSRLLKAAAAQGLPTIETEFGGDLAPGALSRAKGILKEYAPDLVVVNFNKEAWQFGVTAKILRIPILARHGFPLLRDKLHHRYLMTQVLSKLVVNAASIREHYRQIGLPVDGVDVIHNGTAVVVQKCGELRRRFAIGDDELLVLCAGRLESQKRFDLFLDVAARLDKHTRFLIAGDGPLADELQEKIDNLGLQDRVQLTGFLPDFAEIAGDADLFLLTSENEGTPNVLLEAMAAGVACVAFGVGAVPEILGGELAENVVAPEDVAAMAARAEKLLGNESLRNGVAEEMRARIVAEFSRDGSMQKFAEVFQQTIKRR